MTYVICTDGQTALRIAKRVQAGEIPDLYRIETMAVQAWRDQPLPMQTRYRIWSVTAGACVMSVVPDKG